MFEIPAGLAGTSSLKDFYRLMEWTAEVRREVTRALVNKDSVPAGAFEALRNALQILRDLPRGQDGDMSRTLELGGGRSLSVDLNYEITELQKDLLFLEEGEGALLDLMRERIQGFDDHIRSIRLMLGSGPVGCFATDRDGTTNNYCGRYRSSTQSAYNALFLSRFCRERARKPVMLTSAPLSGGGVVDVNVTPEGTMVLAASKGRECLDLSGRRHQMEVEPEKQQALNVLNERLKSLLDRPEYEKFGLIGSGLQFKFGQTTVARQDVGKSVDDDESDGFLRTLTELVHDLDPDEKTFRMEDTGLDVEIILTVEGGGGLKDFDKGDGLLFLDRELGLDLSSGMNLVCGDTASDIPMIRAAAEQCENTKAIFVTKDGQLAAKVLEACGEAVVVPEPDILVAALGALG